MRRIQTHLFPLISISVLLCLSNFSFAQNWTGIISPSRAVNWSTVGVAGGIPKRTTNCATLNSGATIAQINSAIAACPSGQVVFLNAGTYNLSTGMVVNSHNNVTVRGAGADKTLLVFSNHDGCHGFFAAVCLESSDLNWKGGPTNLVNWTAGYAKGTSTITLASVPNLKVGNPVLLDQNDDSCDNGGIIVSASTSSCSILAVLGIGGPFSNEGNGGGAQRSGRNQVQIVTVISCGGVTTPGASCSGTNVSVGISPGLYMPNWRSGQTPQAWWATSPLQGVGIEDVSVDVTSAGTSAAGIEIFNCLNCWVTGTRIIDTGRAHVQVQYSARITLRNNYEFLTQNSVSQSYGDECYTASDMLVENNIYQAVASPQMINGACSGSVVGYNFNINNYYTQSSGYSLAGSNLHTGGIDNLLYEGNVGNQVYGDLFHGTHHFITAFRNRWSGPQPACWISGSTYATSTFGACNNNYSAIVLQSFSRFYNLVGNVVGTSGENGGYDSGTHAIMDIGGGTGIVPDDPNVLTTTMRWGNYDTTNGAARFVSSEVPSSLTGAQASFSNPVPSTQSLPDSFYYSSQPAWWPSAKPWPPIGPDVTGGNIAGLAGHAYTIPSQDCFLNVMKGPANGTGPVLGFNAANCYGSASGGGGTTTPPAPPTGLNATVS